MRVITPGRRVGILPNRLQMLMWATRTHLGFPPMLADVRQYAIWRAKHPEEEGRQWWVWVSSLRPDQRARSG